jgi:hypothetical protein
MRKRVTSCLLLILTTGLAPLWAQSRPEPAGRVAGAVIDQTNAIALPGVPVTVVSTQEVVYTDLDGRYRLELAPGSYELRIELGGYAEQTVRVTVVPGQTAEVQVALSPNRFSEAVTVEGEAVDAETSTAAAQLMLRKNAPVITDNLGAQEMRANGDSNAAVAMTRVTGISLVDNQYVYVRGLGERYSNTTLSGSTLPTTEPDKKVVPLDLFPAGLLDSVQVAKSYSPDKSAEFAGGLVQIVPLKFPTHGVFTLSLGASGSSLATGRNIPLSPLGSRDLWGYDRGARALPLSFPAEKIVRRGIFTPEVGFSPDEITQFGRALENRWVPETRSGRPGQSWGAIYGNRFGKLGVVTSVTHSYKEQYVEENRKFFIIDNTGNLDIFSDYDFEIGTQKAQLGVVGNAAYQFTSNHRIGIENFYSHSGRDEGRVFEGPNTDRNFILRNYRLQFIEEGLFANGVTGEHFVPGWRNSLFDWRVSSSRATRDEPDLRETLYFQNIDPVSGLGAGPFRLADATQSGFRLFNVLADDTVDLSANWSSYATVRSLPLQVRFGPSYVRRTRDFTSRRFRFIPTNTRPVDLTRSPEAILAAENVGVDFRFNEDTRPTDAYDAIAETTAFYGMTDLSWSSRMRVVAGARVERFDLTVNTFDPFGLFVDRITAILQNTDVFPAVNLVHAFRPNTNLRLGYSQTVNRPEFRELAAFEFTDIVGNKAVRGNPDLTRALVRNIDLRIERFGGGRSVVAASVFYKGFDDPIERVVSAGAQPLTSYENADSASNFGFELEMARQIGRHLFVSGNYTYVDSEIRLTEAARRVQTSLVRPLAGQSRNLFNVIGEFTAAGFTARALYNYFGDRISDVGSNGTPDIVEDGRGLLDIVVSQRLTGRFGIRLTVENLTNAEHTFLQGIQAQRFYRAGRTIGVSFGLTVF